MKDALRPIASLITKSKKAQQRLTPGTWQHTMLQNNLQALRIASSLMIKGADGADSFTRDDLQTGLRALADMIDRSEKAQAKFSPGTPQHTLQRNRIKALTVAEALIKAALDKTDA